MKIRTRLLLFFLPLGVGGIILISMLSAYHLMGIMHATLTPDMLASKVVGGLFLIFGAAFLTICAMVGALFWIAHRLSRPVQKLNNSALAIAAGQYGESIKVKGPKEISELANTLNTMSECLLENINRLKENSLLHEQMYGEYECSRLLAHLMLQKNIENCKSDAIAIKPITILSENPKGLLLEFPKNDTSSLFHIHMAEAEEAGIEGMYQLLIRSKERNKRGLFTLNRSQSTIQWNGAQIPLVWSLRKNQWIQRNGNETQIETGDFFFLWNIGFALFYKTPEQISRFLSRVLKIFAQDGLETTSAILQKEMGFALRRKNVEEDLHLLCFQILKI